MLICKQINDNWPILILIRITLIDFFLIQYTDVGNINSDNDKVNDNQKHDQKTRVFWKIIT